MTGTPGRSLDADPLASTFHALKAAALERDDSVQDLLDYLHIHARRPSARALLSFLKAHYLDQVDGRLWLSRLAGRPAEPGVSIVSCSMDRTDNLLKSLHSWLELPVDEIVVVDWSSRDEVHKQLGEFSDSRIKVVRIEGESRWVLTNAFNVGLQFASREKVYKLDADIRVAPSFLERNDFQKGEFVRGNWEVASRLQSSDQKYVNGSFGAFKSDLHKAGYYNEFIRKYGWDDTELYTRLTQKLRLDARFIDNASLEHLPQDEEQRLLNQDANRRLLLGMYDPTEYYNMFNKNLCKILPDWDPRLLDDYVLQEVEADYFVGQRATAPVPIPPDILDQAARSGITDILSWDRKMICGLSIAEPRIAQLLAETFERGQEQIGARLLAESGPEPRTAAFDAGRFDLPLLISLRKEKGMDCFLLAAEGKCRAWSVKNRADDIVLVAAEPDLLSTMEEAFAAGVRNPVVGDWKSDSLSAAEPVLAVSLYDEKNEARLDEYLFCVENNLDRFSWIVVFYEEATGAMYECLQERLSGKAGLDKIIFVAIDGRPSFESMFSFMDLLFSGASVVVANADIAFDGTIGDVVPALSDDVFMVLSRREVKGTDLSVSSPILNSLDIPNTHSADAWIYRAPRKFPFRADFGIGTFHCDSFLNNYIGKSGYRLFNPCISVNAFHIHHPDFNSSVTKNIEQQEQISAALAEETRVNGGELPIKGVEWCTLGALESQEVRRNLVDWKDTLFRIEIDADLRNLYPALLTALTAWRISESISEFAEVWLLIKQPFASESARRLLDSLRSEFNLPRLRFGICNAEDSDLTESLSRGHRFHRVHGADLGSVLVDGSGVHIPNRHADQPIDLWAGVNNGVVVTAETALNDSEISAMAEALGDEDRERMQQMLVKLEHDGGPGTQSWVDELSVSLPARQGEAPNGPSVAFVTSIYNGDRYMAGYLQNVAAAASRLNARVICIDANSPGNEHRLFQDFIVANPQFEALFEYIRLEKDPGLYECWRIAIERSEARYVTNANLDDRRSPLHTASLVRFLEENPGYAAAATAIRPVHDPSIGWYDAAGTETWFRHGFPQEIGFDSLYRRDEEGNILSQNVMHCMPVWRRQLHEKHGYFDEESYGTSADWAFWLKCTLAGEKLGLVPLVLAQYLVNPDSHNRLHDAEGEKELAIIREFIAPDQERYLQQ